MPYSPNRNSSMNRRDADLLLVILAGCALPFEQVFE